jgi:hypothetical protein
MDEDISTILAHLSAMSQKLEAGIIGQACRVGRECACGDKEDVEGSSLRYVDEHVNAGDDIPYCRTLGRLRQAER